MRVSLAVAGIAIKLSLAGMFMVAGAMVLLVTAVAAGQKAVREID